jgi:hypothetical protein
MQNLYVKFSGLKKIILVLIMAEIFNFTMISNPGDTTWVTVWNLRKLTYTGSYDTTAVFPTNLRYRKIRLHYILGRYACPPNTQYCGSWDYTTQIVARHAGMDSVEIARIITPYATDWLQQNKKHDYIVEVTDYATALDGTTAMRFNYQGYSFGFTITLKIEFIEGVPPMDALSVTNVYDGYYTYGSTSDPIENHLSAKPYSYASPTSKAFLKNTVSGHGSDNMGCSEFCSKYYQLKINNSVVSQNQLWRSDCGINEVYPQTGTWIYERGNWCPGAVVWPIYHDLTPITTPNTTFTVDVDMQPYVNNSPSGGYNWVSHLIKYSAPNHTRDVSIEDIASPTKDDNYFRENPNCNSPIIKIKNVGTDTLTSITFTYGIQGSPPLTHTWTGSLAFLQESTEVFPGAPAILSSTATNVFEVSAIKINGITGDQNSFNNTYTSKTMPVAVFPANFVIKMFTNKSTDPNTGFNETTWTLYDENEFVVAFRSALTNTTSYIDTVVNLAPGCYKMVIDDAGCDGMSWWANTAAGNGSLRFDYLGANNTIFLVPGDIGCNFTKFFVVKAPVVTVGINNNSPNPDVVEIYPNPADNVAYLKLDLNKGQTLHYKIIDMNGRLVQEKTVVKPAASYETVDLHDLSNGVYMISVELADHSIITKKLVIQK